MTPLQVYILCKPLLDNVNNKLKRGEKERVAAEDEVMVIKCERK